MSYIDGTGLVVVEEIADVGRSTLSDSAVVIRRKPRSRSVGIHTVIAVNDETTAHIIDRIDVRVDIVLPTDRGGHSGAPP